MKIFFSINEIIAGITCLLNFVSEMLISKTNISINPITLPLWLTIICFVHGKSMPFPQDDHRFLTFLNCFKNCLFRISVNTKHVENMWKLESIIQHYKQDSSSSFILVNELLELKPKNESRGPITVKFSFCLAHVQIQLTFASTTFDTALIQDDPLYTFFILDQNAFSRSDQVV